MPNGHGRAENAEDKEWLSGRLVLDVVSDGVLREEGGGGVCRVRVHPTGLKMPCSY